MLSKIHFKKTYSEKIITKKKKKKKTPKKKLQKKINLKIKKQIAEVKTNSLL